MTQFDSWQESNQRYLSAAMKWLRLGLKQLALTSGSAASRPDNGGKKAGEKKTKAADRATGIQRAAERMVEEEKKRPPPALPLLSDLMGLTEFEKNLLLLCAAMEIDTGMGSLCASVQGGPDHGHATFALALALFENPVWEALSPERPLRYWRMVEVVQTGSQPLTASALRADERIVAYIKGLNFLDDRIAPFLVPFQVADDGIELPPSQQAAVDRAVRYLRQVRQRTTPDVLQLIGTDYFSKQLVALRTSAVFGLRLFRLPAELLPGQVEELDKLARLWQRESMLLPVALYIDAHSQDSQPAPVGQVPPLQRFLARCRGVFFLGIREVQSSLDATTTVLEIDKPTVAEQHAAWSAALGPSAGESPALLSAQFNLNVAAIRKIADQAAAEKASEQDSLQRCLWRTCLVNTRPHLDLLAQRLDPKATWADIVLTAETEGLLRQIASQVRQRGKVYDQWGFRDKMNRGLGISALFAGESGTGKTMAAEVIANDLDLNLYRIDLSQVVSKYIGETEKNLCRLFDAADDGGAILFFDEADALFGKRSEVKDSHDRYANIEINYLLQRLETYRGLAILATNMKSALDRAFLRRLRFIVNFSFPEAPQREAIWKGVFPPLVRIDPRVAQHWNALARLNITGGSIHNIALNAAFLAAQADHAVTMPDISEAARQEFRKMERPVHEVDVALKQPQKAAK
jgi:hypothetical protein